MKMDDDSNVIEDDFLTRLEIVVDGETRLRLIALADACHSTPKMIAASLLHDVLMDDADAHADVPTADNDDEIVTLN